MIITTDDLIKYKKGLLSTEQMKEVEKELKNDETLQDAYDGLNLFLEKEGEEQLEPFYKESKKELEELFEKSKPKRYFSYYLVAATLIVLIGISAVLQLTKTNVSDFDFRDDGLPVFLSPEKSTEINKAMNAYKLEDYDKALEILQFLNTEIPNDTITYYIGVILKEKKEYQKALDSFNNITSESSFYQKTEFQVALCYWYLEDLESAERWFKDISITNGHPFKERAFEALRSL